MEIFRYQVEDTDLYKMFRTKTKLLANHQNYQALVYFLRNHEAFSSLAAAKVFANTLNLPSLPVPKLSQTIEKYIKTVTPFLNQNELNNTKMLLNEFNSENGIGSTLQNLLVQKAESSENWLADWWLNVAYLEYRDPVVVYSSPGLVFPFEDFENQRELLSYTANLILAAIKYKNEIYSDKIPLDMMGKDFLDMNQYKKIFGTCRIPQDKRDGLEYHPDSKHITLVRNNNLEINTNLIPVVPPVQAQPTTSKNVDRVLTNFGKDIEFFKLDILNNNREVPSLNQLITQLEIIIKESEIPGPPIGILSSDNRDNWSKAYQELIKDPQNEKSVKEIQTSLFLVALDNPMPELKDSRRSMASKQFIHGGGSRANSANRWFDKTVQFIIGEDGTVGLTYEHSPSEGQPIAVMTDYLIDFIKRDGGKDLPDTKLESFPEKLSFNVNGNVDECIHLANRNVDKLVANLDMDSFQFKSFGKEFVKSQKLSPDSFIQIAIQYAFYRLHKVPGAHYESAATRKYIHGRTETIRSCSIESIAFAKAMLDKRKNFAEKEAALKQAIDSHKKYTIDAINGFGVDRHFLGLKLVASQNGIQLPNIYKDPSFTRSSHMRLSTSQVATKCDGFMCYGPLTVDGYGCCYNPRSYDINFGVSAFVEHSETSARKFREALEASLQDMHDLLARHPKAKL